MFKYIVLQISRSVVSYNYTDTAYLLLLIAIKKVKILSKIFTINEISVFYINKKKCKKINGIIKIISHLFITLYIDQR
jgi:hypothetical protein